MVLSFLAGALVAAALAPSARAQEVVRRARLGNNGEDITFIGSGSHAHHLAIMNGYDVFAVPTTAKRDDDGDTPKVKKLFDVFQLPIRRAPRGIVYIESTRQFAFDDPSDNTRLYLSDEKGRPTGTLPITFLPTGFKPTYFEGLVYIPPSAAVFPDHIAFVANDDNQYAARIEVMRLDGVVEAEITPDPGLGRIGEIGGLGFLLPDKLLVNQFDDQIWTLDFSGNVIGAPVTLPGNTSLEGIVQLDDGRVVASAYSSGQLFFLDANLNRLTGQDATYSVGVGLSIPWGVAWNPDAGEHLIANFGAQGQPGIAAVPPSLDTATPAVDFQANGFFFGARGLTYLPDEHLSALAHFRFPSALFLFNGAGVKVDTIDLATLGVLRGVAYLPSTRQFAVIAGRAGVVSLNIITRTGTLVSSVDLGAKGISAPLGLAYFNPSHPSGGQFLIIDLGPDNLIRVTDFNGNIMRNLNFRDAFKIMSPVDLSTITSGPDAGSFGLVDRDSSELIVFRLEDRED